MTSAEYFRLAGDINSVTQNMSGKVYSWDARGDVTNNITGKIESDKNKPLYSPDSLFEWVRVRIKDTDDDDTDNPVVWIVHDLQMFMGNPDPAMVASFRDVVREGAQKNHHLVLIGATSKLCPEIEKMVTAIEYELPTREEIQTIIEETIAEIDWVPEVDADEMERLITASAGMTSTEVEDAVSLSLVSESKLCWRLIMSEKAKAVSKTGCLKYVDTKVSRDDVGGNEVMMDYIDLRKDSFSQRAKEFGLPAPKGVLLVGPAGTGKSLGGKVTASILDRPLIIFDVGAVFGSLVGQSEEQMRMALKTIEACSPCVLMIDEIEKALAGSKSSGQTDGGTGSRVIGTLLSWMNDKESEVYIMATANDVSGLPPEMLRKGRFDELFFVDLPSKRERKIIFEIHLKKRGRDPKKFDLKSFVDETEGYTGAEIEQIVIDGLYTAFGLEKDDVEDEDIVKAIHDTAPLSRVNGAQIEALNAWAKDRCRYASSDAGGKTEEKKTPKRRVSKKAPTKKA